jgi:hypothetical protein
MRLNPVGMAADIQLLPQVFGLINSFTACMAKSL